MPDIRTSYYRRIGDVAGHQSGSCKSSKEFEVGMIFLLEVHTLKQMIFLSLLGKTKRWPGRELV